MSATTKPLNPASAILIVFAGPAGSGKSTLCERIVKELPGFSRVITATTRAPRTGEIDGVHYHFLSPEEFDRKIAENAFLEWAWVHKKNRYGTLRDAVIGPLARGESLVINIDVQGVDNFRKAADETPLLRRHMTTVYIDVSIDVLRERLAGRGTDNQEEIDRRMKTAEIESLHKNHFDHIIESRSREEDYQELLRILDTSIKEMLGKQP